MSEGGNIDPIQLSNTTRSSANLSSTRMASLSTLCPTQGLTPLRTGTIDRTALSSPPLRSTTPQYPRSLSRMRQQMRSTESSPP